MYGVVLIVDFTSPAVVHAKRRARTRKTYLALLRAVATVALFGPKRLRAPDEAAQDVRRDRLCIVKAGRGGGGKSRRQKKREVRSRAGLRVKGLIL